MENRFFRFAHAGGLTTLNTANIFAYEFVHTGPNSVLTVKYDPATTIAYTIPIADAKQMEKNMNVIFHIVDFNSISPQ